MPDANHFTHTATRDGRGSVNQTSSPASRPRASRGDGPIPCGHPGCSKMFWQMCSRNRHFESHNVRYACDKPGCKAGPWAQKAGLDRHIAEHEGRPTIPCRHPMCEEMFFQPYPRHVHERQEHPVFMKTHADQKARRLSHLNSAGGHPDFSDDEPPAIDPASSNILDVLTSTDTGAGRTDTMYGYPCIPISKDEYEAALVLTQMPQADR